ncbi:uncharacterized protein DUF3179 [Melghirimyces profundicolus]|uniref:Uncharacterized protein DUF3179 n=1 Tax=Melghirimyces profundicolus TaxID=1242148 RepID=A0A2T6BH23_9BACL|nr:DUF3179 domain-containing (seleno)protein [Melghirimyces profundicolus]PTX55360.1 uncharacterized protein DUF3179 [Melghirimyces profundicolus]
MTTIFDADRAWLSDEDLFDRLEVKEARSLKETLQDGTLLDEDELLVVERGGKAHAFSVFQMAYHHTAQGELAGEPYLVAF